MPILTAIAVSVRQHKITDELIPTTELAEGKHLCQILFVMLAYSSAASKVAGFVCFTQAEFGASRTSFMCPAGPPGAVPNKANTGISAHSSAAESEARRGNVDAQQDGRLGDQSL